MQHLLIANKFLSRTACKVETGQGNGRWFVGTLDDGARPKRAAQNAHFALRRTNRSRQTILSIRLVAIVATGFLTIRGILGRQGAAVLHTVRVAIGLLCRQGK
jgi:hypothetical protein